MRLAIFTSGGAGWALTNVSAYLAAGLSIEGHEVDLIPLYDNERELRHLYGDVGGFDSVTIRPLRVGSARVSLPSLARYLRKAKPDVIFSQLTYINAVAVLARMLSAAPCKNVLLEGTILTRALEETPELRLARPLVRLTYPRAHGIVGKSAAVVEDLRRFFGRRLADVRVVSLPNPYALDRFRRLAREEVSMPWPAAPSVPIVVSVGRLAHQKAFDVLLEAFTLARAQRPCRLLLLGDGPDRSSLQQLAERLHVAEHVAMPGWVDNPWAYVARSTVFVLPSRWEGWPSALMEAMALGMPVITTDCEGGGRELVRDRENGLLVPVDDVSRMGEAVSHLLSDATARRRLGAAAERTAAEYGHEHVARRYAEFATSLLATERGRS